MFQSKPKVITPGPLQRLVASFLGLMQAHLGLFGIELEEAREHLFKTLILAILGAGSVLLGLLTATLAIILMVDEVHRLGAVLGLLGFFALLAGVCLGLAWRGLRRGNQLFALTIDELRRDRERLLP